MSEFWCVCRKYCNTERTSIRSRSTWYRHLQEADDDEKENIRLAKFSDAFRASAAPTPSTSAGPSNLKRRSESNDDDNNSVPRKRDRSEHVMEQDANSTSRQGSLAPSLRDDLPEPDIDRSDPPEPDFNPPEPDFDPPEPDFDPPQPQPDPRPNPQQLPPNNERRRSPLWDLDLDELSNMARIPKLQQDMLFIRALRESVRPLPRMISSTTMTTTITPHINTSPSPPSPGPSNKPLLPAVPAAPSPITPAPTTNAKRMRPGPNKNGRTLCAHRWLNGVAKDGTTADFKIYWTALPKDAKKKYELEAAQLVASGVWHANTADTILNVSSGTVY